MTLTCLIPAWNEAARIGGVLEAVAGHPLIDRLLVIDDGSTDGTGEIARARGIEVRRTRGNIGKTAALAQGLRDVAGGQVMFLDADLLGLTPGAVSRLIAPVTTGRAMASVSLRGNAPGPWRMIGLDYISGERVLPFDLIAAHLDAFHNLPRFGFEVFLNRLLIAKAAPLAIVPWPEVSSPSKAAKRGSHAAGLRADAAMLGDMFRTVGARECLHQIIALRRLRVDGGAR